MTRSRSVVPVLRSVVRLPLVSAFVLVVFVLAPSLGGWAWGADAPEIVEQVDVAIVQVDVSVIDPKSNSRASVRGLTAADFDVRVDGRPLGAEERAALIVDEMCSAVEAAQRPVIVAVDFNYVDAAGRDRVAEALDRIADAPVPGLAYKFYGLTREVRALSDGFVSDPAAIRKVAGLVRATDFVGDRASVATVRDLIANSAGGCSG